MLHAAAGARLRLREEVRHGSPVDHHRCRCAVRPVQDVPRPRNSLIVHVHCSVPGACGTAGAATLRSVPAELCRRRHVAAGPRHWLVGVPAVPRAPSRPRRLGDADVEGQGPKVTALTMVQAVRMPCWYAQGDRRPRISRCPATCNGSTTHAERLAGGTQRFYCEGHAFWRASEVGREHVRPLRPGESA
jgi:hypothetical protein